MDPLDERLGALAARQDGVLTRLDVLAAGGSDALVRRRLRGGSWQPLLRGSYLAARDPVPLGARAWARAAVLLVDGSAAARRTAAGLLGIEGAPVDDHVEVAAARSAQTGDRRLRAHQFLLREDEVVDVGGIACTSVARTLVDLVPTLSRLGAIAVLDSAVRQHGLAPQDLAAARLRAVGRRGCVHVEDLWALADGRAETPLESRVRLRCIDARLPPDDLQHEIRDEHGRLLARADMLFRARRRAHRGPLLLEADGKAPHDSPEALYRDRWRQNTLVALGYDVVRCTWEDTRHPDVVPQMLRAAL